MLRCFLVSYVCLAVACSDPGLSPTGGVGGNPATGGSGGTGGSRPLEIELRDFSGFTSFRYSAPGPEQACPAMDMTSYAEFALRKDGGLDFSYAYLNIDEECPSSEWSFPECQTVERGGPRVLSSDEALRVRELFTEVLLTGPTADQSFCFLTAEEGAEACDASFVWDDTRLTDSPCVRLSVSRATAMATRLMFDALRLTQ